MNEINAWVIEKWRSKRIKSGVSANTCNRDLATLKSSLNRAVAWGILSALFRLGIDDLLTEG